MSPAHYRDISSKREPRVSNSQRSEGLLLPSDAPPALTDIKRNLLFFDRLSIQDADDSHLINSAERSIPTDSPQATIISAPTVPYPRVAEYAELYQELREQLVAPMHRGQIVFLPSKMKSEEIDRLVPVYAGAVSQEELLSVAVPDRTASPPLTRPVSGLLTPLTGAISKDLKLKLRSEIPGPASLGNRKSQADTLWTLVACGRWGQTLKYLEHARQRNAIPVSTTASTDKMLARIIRNQLVPVGDESIDDLILPYELFDELALNDLLKDMTWKDVFELRRKLLPALENLRSVVVRHGIRIDLQAESAETRFERVRDELAQLKKSFVKAQEDASVALTKLGVQSVLKGAAGVSGGAATKAVAGFMVPGIGWTGVLLGCVVGVTVAGGALSSQLSEYFVQRRKLKSHPLFVLSQCATLAS